VGAVVVGLPGIAAIGHGKGRVPALTFSHWIYYGASHQTLPVEWWAFAAAAAALVVGVAGGAAVSRAELTRRVARLGLRLRIPTLAARPGGRALGVSRSCSSRERSGGGGGGFRPRAGRASLRLRR